MQHAFCIYLLIYTRGWSLQTHQGKKVQAHVKFLGRFAFTIVTSTILSCPLLLVIALLSKPDLRLWCHSFIFYCKCKIMYSLSHYFVHQTWNQFGIVASCWGIRTAVGRWEIPGGKSWKRRQDVISSIPEVLFLLTVFSDRVYPY